MDKLPYTSEELIEALDKAFPLQNPTLNQTIEDIQRKAGKRELIEYLLFLLKREKEESFHNQ